MGLPETEVLSSARAVILDTLDDDGVLSSSLRALKSCATEKWKASVEDELKRMEQEGLVIRVKNDVYRKVINVAAR